MKTILRRAICAPVHQTNPPQFFPIEWQEVDVEFEMRQADKRRRLTLILSLVSFIFGMAALVSVVALAARET